MEEQAPVEEKQEVTLKEEGEKKKKKIFSLFLGCFRGKSQVVLEKPETQEQAYESDEDTEDKLEEDHLPEDEEDKPFEDKSAEENSAEDESAEDNPAGSADEKK